MKKMRCRKTLFRKLLFQQARLRQKLFRRLLFQQVRLRAKLFRRLLGALERRTPGAVRSLQCQILLNMTARAFGVPGRGIWMYAPGRALHEYMRFTVQCMEHSSDSSLRPVRLFRESYRVGDCIRAVSGFTDREDLQRLVFYLYRNIGIYLRGVIPGSLAFTECYFSRFYTPRQCHLMSYMDSGLIAGLFGGGHLTFTGRITEGCSVCSAGFQCARGAARAFRREAVGSRIV